MSYYNAVLASCQPFGLITLRAVWLLEPFNSISTVYVLIITPFSNPVNHKVIRKSIKGKPRTLAVPRFLK